MQTRARDCQVHMLSSTWMNSMIASPKPKILANAEEQETAVVWADVDLDATTTADPFFWEYLYSGVQNRKERHLKFRRPDACGVLAAPHLPLMDQYP